MYSKIGDRKEKLQERFDEIDKSYIESVDFINLFKREEKLIKEMIDVKKKSRYLDYLFLEYDNIKKNINNEINKNIKELNIINSSSDKVLDDSYKQNSYVYHEYKLLVNITNTGEYLKIINDLKIKIELLLKGITNENLLLEYKLIQKEYNEIFIFVTLEKKEKDNKIPNFREFVNNKKSYLNSIGNLLYKKKIFDSYIYKLEDIYTTIVDHKLKK